MHLDRRSTPTDPILYDTYDPQSDTGGSPAPTPNLRLPGILRKIPLPLSIPTQGGGGSSGAAPGPLARTISWRALFTRPRRLDGGRVYEARKDLSYLRAAFSHIAEELRRQYSLGYYPRQMPRKGERRRIKVEVSRPDLAVRARDSCIYQPSTPATPSTPSTPSTQGPSTTVDTAKDNEQRTTAPVLQKKPFIVEW